MRALYDVSALIALLDKDHTAHSAVAVWHITNIGEGWASCPLAQNGFLRIVSRPGYPSPVSLTEAFGLLRAAVSTSNYQFIADDITLLDDTLVQYRDLSSYRQLTDVYLLALAVAHGARLVTLDTRISRSAVRGATSEHLAVIQSPH